MTNPLPQRIQGIVLDIDGTLYDQRRLRFSMARLMLTECFKDPSAGLRAIRLLRAFRASQEALRREPDVPDWAAEQLDRACRLSRVSRADAAAIIERYFERAPLPRLHRCRRPNLLDFLEKVRERGIRLGVWSDYPAAAKLEALGISPCFDAVISASDPEVNRLKPDPAGLHLCMARLGVRPEETVYVGDRVDVDAECARRAGVCSIIIGSRPNLRGGAIMVDGFEELGKLLL